MVRGGGGCTIALEGGIGNREPQGAATNLTAGEDMQLGRVRRGRASRGGRLAIWLLAIWRQAASKLTTGQALKPHWRTAQGSWLLVAAC